MISAVEKNKAGKGGSKECWRGRAQVLKRVVREGPMEEQRLEEMRDLWSPGRGKSKCKVPEAETRPRVVGGLQRGLWSWSLVSTRGASGGPIGRTSKGCRSSRALQASARTLALVWKRECVEEFWAKEYYYWTYVWPDRPDCWVEKRAWGQRWRQREMTEMAA